MKYRYEIRWTPRYGETATYAEEWFDTAEEMESARRDAVKRIGWTPPRWWQWWRWDDSPRALPGDR